MLLSSLRCWQQQNWFKGATNFKDNCLAFEGMSLFTRLENGLLAPGLCLFGDNAYLNPSSWQHHFLQSLVELVEAKMAAYNFYHSQRRIQIQCAFGMLTHRWAILRRAIPMRVSLKKTIALVIALAKLHNFCIDENEVHVPPCGAADELETEMQGGIPLESTQTPTGSPVLLPRQLIDGGLHFDDVEQGYRRCLTSTAAS